MIAVIITSKDVTKEKLAAQALKDSEERWRFALEGSNQGLWDWNMKTGECFYSASYKKLYGFTENEIKNHIEEWEKRAHPDDAKVLSHALKKHIASDDPYYECVYRVKAKNEVYKWILSRGMIIEKDEEGTPKRMIGTHTDITEQKRAEESYKLLFYSHAIPMWTYDLQTLKIQEVNEAAIHLYGYTRKEFLNLTLKDLRPAEDSSKLGEIIQDISASGQNHVHSVRHKKKSGEIFYVEATGNELTANDRKVRLVSIKDITEQVVAENKLKESESQYRLLFMGNPLPSFIYEIDTLRFLEVNQAAIEFYGFSRKEFLQMQLPDLHAKEQEELVKQTIAANNKRIKIAISRWQQQKKNGDQVWVRLSGNKISYNKKDARLIVTDDITAKVKAAEDLVKINERFHLAAKATSEALWDWDIETGEAYTSPVYKDMFGFEHGPHDNWYSSIHPEEKEEAAKSFYAALENPAKDRWEREYRHLKADGGYLYVRNSCLFIRDEHGKAVKAVGAMQDITKKKIAEQELIMSNDRFELATTATSDAIYDWNVLMDKMVWGAGLKLLFGYDDMQMDQWEEQLHPQDKNLIANLNATLADKTKNLWKAEYRLKVSSGAFRYVFERGFIQRNESGIAVRMVGAVQDITELKTKEKELLKSNDRYKYASLATADVIWDFNIRTGNVLWSDNFTKVFGWELPEDKLLPVTFCSQNFHPGDRQRVWDSLQEAIKNPALINWNEELRYQKKDGTYAFITDRGYVIRNEQGEALRMIGAMQDITEQKYAAELTELERQIFELSATAGSDFTDVVTTLLKGIEKLHPGMITSVVLLNTDQTIKTLAAPRLDKEFKEGVDGLQIGPTEGSCGAAMFLKKTVIVANIETDPLWKKYKNFAAKFGLKAAWSLPVIDSAGAIIGSLAIYHKIIKEPTEIELNTVERFRNLLRILMEKESSFSKINDANKRFDSVMEATHDLIWDWDLETGSFYRDKKGLQKVFGIEKEESISNIYLWMQRIHPDDHAHVEKVINDIIKAANQETFDMEYRFKKDDGTYNYVYDRGTIVRNAEGKPVRMIGAAQDITERKRLEQELLQRELEKQKMIGQATIETQEQERSEIGKELHDNVNQVLTTTKLYLDLSLSNPEMKDELIQKSSKNVIYVINEIRQLSRSLMNPSLGDLGLVDAINDLIENINLTRKLHVVLKATAELEERLAENQKVSLFRIVQEALNNAMKHAKATTVIIHLTEKEDSMRLHITDDGIGFNPVSVKKGSGLKNIQNRVYLANGTISMESKPGAGCQIEINIPIKSQ